MRFHIQIMRRLEPRKQLAQPARRLRSKVAHWRSPSFSITTTKRIGLQCQISTKTRSLLYPDIKPEPGGEQLRGDEESRFGAGIDRSDRESAGFSENFARIATRNVIRPQLELGQVAPDSRLEGTCAAANRQAPLGNGAPGGPESGSNPKFRRRVSQNGHFRTGTNSPPWPHSATTHSSPSRSHSPETPPT